MTKKNEPREVSVRGVIDGLRSCWHATVETMKKDTKKAREFETRCYRDLFKLVTGRKPTAEELEHMTGGTELKEKT